MTKSYTTVEKRVVASFLDHECDAAYKTYAEAQGFAFRDEINNELRFRLLWWRNKTRELEEKLELATL